MKQTTTLPCLVLLFCAALTWSGLAIAENPARRALQEKEALARVGQELIGADEYLSEIERLRTKAPSLVVDRASRRQVLDDMVRRRMLLLRAIDAGYSEHPHVMEVWEKMVIKTFMRESLDTRLEEIEVEESEVEAWYAEQAARYVIPARSRAAIVFYELVAHASSERKAEVREKADAARAEATSLDSSIRHFGEIARRDSDHRASRYQGGVTGWLTHLPQVTSALPNEVVEAVFALEAPGQIAPLVETDEGFYLVRLVEREASRAQPLEQVAAGIRHQLLREKRIVLRQSFEAELQSQVGVEIDEQLFATVDQSVEPPTPPALPSINQTQ